MSFPILTMKLVLFLFGQGLVVLALTVKSAYIRRLFFLPIACISLYLVFSPLQLPFPFLANYLFTCGHLSNVLIASDYLLLTDAQAELRLQGQTSSISTLSFYSRLKWVVSLLGSPRGIGWTHEPSKALPRAHPRNNDLMKFTVHQVARLSFYIVLVLLVGKYKQWDRAILVNVLPQQLPDFFLRPIGVLIWAIPVIVFLDGMHRLLSLILVHARYLKPRDWIPLFGSWREAYTIRRFWGRVWHQMLRRFTSNHSVFLTERVLCIKKGTRASFYVQVLIAFLTSATIHATVDWVFIGEWRGAFHFFLLQAIAMLVEDIVTSKVGDSFWLKNTSPGIGYCFGYLWVIFWFTFSIPFWRISFIQR
ncbi:hypothetical protein AX15_004617 [Amanita polypyramis BW_CC]|nr:hypothetical protein AX15_004617 [Amanita polypyramis BW_CC]